eukprot:Clim_evm12s14 gene=Clim_evmTU12s14
MAGLSVRNENLTENIAGPNTGNAKTFGAESQKSKTRRALGDIGNTAKTQKAPGKSVGPVDQPARSKTLKPLEPKQKHQTKVDIKSSQSVETAKPKKRTNRFKERLAKANAERRKKYFPEGVDFKTDAEYVPEPDPVAFDDALAPVKSKTTKETESPKESVFAGGEPETEFTAESDAVWDDVDADLHFEANGLGEDNGDDFWDTLAKEDENHGPQDSSDN